MPDTLPPLKCPKCGQEAPEGADDAAVAEKFYKQRWEGYYTCRSCTRRFSTRSMVVAS